MYIDDRVIFTCAESWEGVTALLRACYAICLDWLTCAGLAMEPDKTELIFFRQPGGKNITLPLSRAYACIMWYCHGCVNFSVFFYVEVSFVSHVMPHMQSLVIESCVKSRAHLYL